MSPAEYNALVGAWKKRERRTAEWFAALSVITNRSSGGKLEMGDLLREEGETE